jgi:hypothetical protein
MLRKILGNDPVTGVDRRQTIRRVRRAPKMISIKFPGFCPDEIEFCASIDQSSLA